MSNCKSCGARIIWEQSNSSGRWFPLNPNGTSHFETCPQRKQWRKQKKIEQEDHVAHLETLDSKQTRLVPL